MLSVLMFTDDRAFRLALSGEFRGRERDWKHICGIISIRLCFADHNAAHKCDLWPWFNGWSRVLVGIRWLFQYGDVRGGTLNAPSQQEMRACLSQENMRSQISDHLMADRCYFTLTEKPSVNKHQMSSNMKSTPWIPRTVFQIIHSGSMAICGGQCAYSIHKGCLLFQ